MIFSGTARRWGQIRRGYLWSVSVRSTDLDFSPQKNLNPYPAQLSVKGVCKGESPVPLCPVLLPFAGAKGRPPRRAVLTMPLQKAPPRRQATTNYPTPEAEKGNRGTDMGEKGGKLNKKACCISMLGGRVRLAICPERLYNYNVVICNAHKEAQTRPNKQEGGMEHGTKPQQ